MTSEQQAVVKDDAGDDYLVPDIRAFHQHILDYHADGVSLHTEGGRMFTVDDEFRRKVAELAAGAGA